MKQTHVSRAGRKAQIIKEIFDKTVTTEYSSSTAYSIAKMVGLAPSSHVKKIVNELAEAGWLNSENRSDFWGRTTVYYWLTNDAYKLLADMWAHGHDSWKILKSEFEQ